MPNDSNQENTQKSEDTATSDKKALSFKDWKCLKESQSKANEKAQKNNTKSKTTNRSTSKSNIDNRNNYNNNGFNGSRGFNCQGTSNFSAGSYMMQGFMPPNNFLGMGNFHSSNGMQNFNSFGMRGNNNFGLSNNSFNNSNGSCFNNFNSSNDNFNRPNNFGGNNFNNGFNRPSNFGNGRTRSNGPNNGDKLDLPDNFFASDGIYRQKDLMQQPLPSYNPFKNAKKAEQLLQEFDKSRYAKDGKKKKGSSKTPSESKMPTMAAKNQQIWKQGEAINEVEVYVSNPKAKMDGKQYIPKPKLPEENLDISKEEKKQQWKEYREAMKPFKNREFYNAKRVVQRLGKIPPSELEDKQIIRLQNARDVMAAHKARLTEKYSNYTKADDDSNELGELYVLKNKPTKDGEFGQPGNKKLQNYGNFGESNDDFESGRKILGGYAGFVPGGILKGSGQSF